MADPVRVRAGWAVWSKRQGSRDDYSVLAASAEPLSKSEAERVLAHFAPGNPPAESGTTSSLPWIMLSRVGVADTPYVGVSVQEPAGYVDGTGRPVSRTRYVCVPYGDLAGEPVSYASLQEAVSSTVLPAEGNGPVTLTVPPLDPAALARDITAFGIDVVAATAALLLSGPVTITGPDLPGWPERLRFLDAVAALLPYGYRAHYTAATWSDTGASPQRFRIVFSRRAGEKSYGVPWGTTPDLRPGAAEQYYASLRRTAKPGADPEELEGLIGYLARQTGQGRFDEPGHAVRIIREFRPAGMIAEDINARVASPDVIRDAFNQHLNRRWSPETRRQALAELIRNARPQDAETIADQLPRIGAEDAGELLPIIAGACRRLVRSGTDTPLIHMYLRTLARFGLDDGLLSALLAPPEPTAADGCLDTIAGLIADLALDDPGHYRLTRQALTGNPAAATALIAHLCAAPGGQPGSGGPEPGGPADSAIGWLEPELTYLLRPFRAVLSAPGSLGSYGGGLSGSPGGSPGGGEAVRDHDVRDLGDRGGPAAVRYLLRVASRRGRLRLVLPAAVRWICRESVSHDGALSAGALSAGALSAGAGDGRSWQDAAMELAPGDEVEAAWLDLALLAARADPKSLLTGKYATPGFAHTVAAEWDALTERLNESLRLGQAADDLLTDSLIGYLGRADWRDDAAKTAIVDRLGELLTGGGQRPLLANAVRDVETALRKMSPRATAAQIAEACLGAGLSSLSAEPVARSLADSAAITSGEQAAEMMDHLHRMILTDPRVPAEERREVAAQWEFELAKAFADERLLGAKFAGEFAAATAGNSIEELQYHVRLLGTGSILAVLGSGDIGRLEELSELLRGVIDHAPAGAGSRRGIPWFFRTRWETEGEGGSG